MANFDIQMAQGSIPGTVGVQADIDTRTGAQALAAAGGEIAQAGIDMSLVMWKLQADTELTDAVAADQEDLNKFFTSLKGNPDTPTYDEEYRKVLDGIESREIKNGLAARSHRGFITKNKPKWNADLTAAKEAKTKDIAYAAMFENEQQAMETGNLMPAIRSYSSNVSAGIMSAEEAAMRFDKTANSAEFRAGQRIAMEEPDVLLGDIKGSKIEGFDTLTEGQVIALRHTAIGQKNYNEKQQDIALSGIYNDVLGRMAGGDSLEEIAEGLRQTQGLTEEERTMLMKTANSAYGVWNTTQSNPWTSTQNYNALMGMQLRISAGSPTTEMDIWGAMLASPDKGPAFSLNDARNLINQLPDRKDEIMKTPFADEWMNHVDEIFLKKKVIPQEDIAEWSQTRQGVEAIIRANYPDVGKAQKEIESFLKSTKQSRAKSWLSDMFSLRPAESFKLGFGVAFGRPAQILNFLSGKISFEEPQKRRTSPADKELLGMTNEELQAIVEGK